MSSLFSMYYSSAYLGSVGCSKMPSFLQSSMISTCILQQPNGSTAVVPAAHLYKQPIG